MEEGEKVEGVSKVEMEIQCINSSEVSADVSLLQQKGEVLKVL